MKKQTKKAEKKNDGRGRDRHTGQLNGSPRKKFMFPVTCKDGLFQCRYQDGEKAKLDSYTSEKGITRASLFVMSGKPFLQMTREELKTEARKAGFMSLAEYVEKTILAPILKK